LASADPAGGASEWQWSLVPYLWASDVGVDVVVNERELIGAQADFRDVVDRLDFAGLVHVEGQKGKAGLFFDLAYFDFNDDPRTLDLTALPLTATVRGDFEVTLLEAGGIYDPGGEGEGFALLFGTRVLDLDQELDITLSPLPVTTRVGASATLVDALLGFRHVSRFGRAWTLAVRGDASSGGTDLTWNGQVLFGYRFGESERYSFLIGYRHLDVELEDDVETADLKTEMTMSGLITGFRIGF
jgi:hypothetical protein